MIVDSLKNTAVYNKIHPLFEEVFEYLRSTDFSKAEVGKVELKGDDLFVIISDSKMKAEQDAKLEVHDRYIDIQLPVSKTEIFGWKARESLSLSKEPFNKERDIQFFEDKYITTFSVSPGDFVVFFPGDAHAPCIGNGKIRKVVVKIKA